MWDFISKIIQAALPSVLGAAANVGGNLLQAELMPPPRQNQTPQSGFQSLGMPGSTQAGVQGAGAGMRSMGLQSGPLSGGGPLADNSNTYNQGRDFAQAPGQGITLPKPRAPFEGI